MEILNKIERRTARIGVIGQGYVGLPLALVFSEAGFTAYGFDVDPKKIAALKQGVSENVDGMAASCFNPRHGIRVIEKGVTTDFVICFECLQVQVYSGSSTSGFLTMSSPQPEFDKVLKAAGVPLAKAAH